MTTANIPSRLDCIGVGLFTIPHLLDQDFAGTLKLLAEMGYKEIEFFGPFPFSVTSAHERWKPIADILGMKQTGYYDLTAHEARAVLDRYELTSPSMHSDLNTLRERMPEIAEAAHLLGQRYVVLRVVGDPALRYREVQARLRAKPRILAACRRRPT